jgi:hypothetical protein
LEDSEGDGEDNIKMDLKKMDCDHMNKIELPQHKVIWNAFMVKI